MPKGSLKHVSGYPKTAFDTMLFSMGRKNLDFLERWQ